MEEVEEGVLQICSHCQTRQATARCGHGCLNVLYCSQNCANLDYKVHQYKCVGAASAPIVWFEKTNFYRASVKKMQSLWYTDHLAWWAIQSYMSASNINTLLYELKSDWSQIDKKLGQIMHKIPFLRGLDPNGTSGKFQPYFSFIMIWNKAKNYYWSGGYMVQTEQDLLSVYPGLRPYFAMSNARFTWEWLYRMQMTILSMPRFRSDLRVWRGYKVLNIPNTLTLDIDQLKVKQRIINWSFLSVALDLGVSAGFLPGGNPNETKCCMLRITIPPGSSPIFLVSGNENDPNYNQSSLVTYGQTEIILAAGVILEITKKSRPKKFIVRGGSTIWSKMADARVVGYAKIKYFPRPK